MKLLEVEAKQLLRTYSVLTPRSWSHGSDRLSRPLMVKAQVHAGGRGLRGGVIVAHSWEEVEDARSRLLSGIPGLPPVADVLIEDFVTASRELFVSITVDRERCCPILMGAAAGGINVEESVDVKTIALDVEQESIRDAAGELVAHLAVPSAAAADFLRTLDALWRLFCDIDCELVEVNPLALDGHGRAVALDAKVTLDDRAQFRHPDWNWRPEPRAALEEAARRLGASAVELSGDIGVMTSGAGLGMATLDLVQSVHGSCRFLVDLAGLVFEHERELISLLEVIADEPPAALLVNCNLQLGTWAPLADAFIDALAGAHLPVIMRLAGNGSAETRERLLGAGFHVHNELEAAVFTAVRLTADQ